MSQDVTTNPLTFDEEIDEAAADEPAADEPIDLLGDGTFSVDHYANRLMDELFGDVDRILDGGSPAADLPTPPEVVSLQPIVIPRLELPAPALVPLESDSALATPDEEAIATLEPSVAERGVNRWLLAAVFASAIASAISWVVFFRAPSPPAEPAATAQPSETDQQFLSYVQRSLDRISNRTATEQAAPPSPTLPSVAVASSPSPSAAPSTVLDRVYVPVYQPPQTLYPPVGVAPPVPVPPVAIAPAPAPVVPVAPRPAAPAPAASAASPAVPAVPPAVAVAPSATPHTLIGLLQLGERSAALFEVNGAPQRIYIGENIASSGWTLVSVSNGEAVIRRNGEVRSIYVGQQF